VFVGDRPFQKPNMRAAPTAYVRKYPIPPSACVPMKCAARSRCASATFFARTNPNPGRCDHRSRSDNAAPEITTQRKSTRSKSAASAAAARIPWETVHGTARLRRTAVISSKPTNEQKIPSTAFRKSGNALSRTKKGAVTITSTNEGRKMLRVAITAPRGPRKM
jgi:hypothetical protein